MSVLYANIACSARVPMMRWSKYSRSLGKGHSYTNTPSLSVGFITFTFMFTIFSRNLLSKRVTIAQRPSSLVEISSSIRQSYIVIYIRYSDMTSQRERTENGTIDYISYKDK